MKHFHFLLLLIFPAISQGQEVSNEASVLKRNGIKSLTISNCISNSGCFSYYYEFNTCGEPTLEVYPMINNYARQEYDQNCRLSVVWVLNHSPKTDSIWKKDMYQYNDKDSILIITQYFENNQPTDTDSRKRSKEKSEPKNIIKNKEGKIIQHSHGDLYYPCGIHYKGTHIFKYVYNKNGLIAHAIIYNDKNELIVNLEYEYKK